ncbi:ParB/RepB/Spo0J family partition protein [Streptomyces xanthochromogenes]
MSGRKTSLASLAGGRVEAVPGMEDPLLLDLPLDKLVPTRFNPRRNFGTNEELREFGLRLAKKQLQPAVVLSRTSYLRLWPEEVEHVGSAVYVIINGERRFRGSSLAGRKTLTVVLREDLAVSRAVVLDSIMSENNDRADLDPIERALGIHTMVEQLNGAKAVANHYGKSEGWVSQQRKLLKLIPPLQELVSEGTMSARIGYKIAGLPAEQQAAAWQEELERRAFAEAQPKEPRRKGGRESQSLTEPASPQPVFSALKSEPAAAEPPADEAAAPVVFSALKTTAPEPLSPPAAEVVPAEEANMSPVPEPRPGAAIVTTPEVAKKDLPGSRMQPPAASGDEHRCWLNSQDPEQVVKLLGEHLDQGVLAKVAELLLESSTAPAV